MAPPTTKRKLAVTAVEKIDFDPSARAEYLTGFHKRKVARQKFAQDEAAKKEKEEKLRLRKELRQQRKVDLEQHVAEVNRLVKQANGDMGIDEAGGTTDAEIDDEDVEDLTGFQEPEPINQEDEYIDEDKYTTVTIESVDISRAGFSVPGKDGDEATDTGKADGREEERKEGEGGIKRDATGKRIWTKERPKTEWPKKKKIKFRYESKADRKATRFKQGAKKRKQREARDKE